MKRAALFDLDRTLVRKETASLYVRHMQKRGEASWRDLAKVMWWVTQYTFGVLDHEEVASRAALSLRGLHETVMSSRCDDWFRQVIEVHLADLGRRAVEEHKAAGDLVAIVTGASPYIARPAARRLGIEHVVASELERDAKGYFTGRFESPLCVGAGKVTRAQRLADAEGFRLEDATFYTDSLTDLPLLEVVREPLVVNPDPRLARVARARGWKVLAW